MKAWSLTLWSQNYFEFFFTGRLYCGVCLFESDLIALSAPNVFLFSNKWVTSVAHDWHGSGLHAGCCWARVWFKHQSAAVVLDFKHLWLRCWDLCIWFDCMELCAWGLIVYMLYKGWAVGVKCAWRNCLLKNWTNCWELNSIKGVLRKILFFLCFTSDSKAFVSFKRDTAGFCPALACSYLVFRTFCTLHDFFYAGFCCIAGLTPLLVCLWQEGDIKGNVTSVQARLFLIQSQSEVQSI